MVKVAVVILNYLNYQDTIECIESLTNDTYTNKEIIIVDNHSNNKSAEILKAHMIKKRFNIHFLINEKNEGFARGNNRGILFARQQLNCEFILLVNNDTIFNDVNLIKNLLSCYRKGVGVIGPRIISKNGYEQNPVTKMNFSKKGIQTKDEIIRLKVKNILTYFKVFYRLKYFVEIYRKNKKILRNKIVKEQKCEDLILHGSCMMLTPDYFSYYPCLYPKTFLYYEENILTILTKKVKLIKLFTGKAQIYHKEDQSSLLSFNNNLTVINAYEEESKKIANELLGMNYDEILKCFND